MNNTMVSGLMFSIVFGLSVFCKTASICG